MWICGNKEVIDEDDFNNIMKHHTKRNGKIIVGTDSILLHKKFIFVNAVCCVGKESKFHGRYFYKRYLDKNEANKNIVYRLMKETTDSIELANLIKDITMSDNIEIHMDVNNNSKFLSGKYSSAVTGYILGAGYNYKIKPDAFVASSVADRHTRPTSSFIKRHMT